MQQGRARQRQRLAVLALAGLVASAVAGCSGSEATAPTSTTAAATTRVPLLDEVDRACGAAAALMYRDATGGATAAAVDDRPAVAGLAPEQIRAFLRDLVDLAGADAVDDIATVAEATDAWAESGALYSDDVRAAFDRVVVWAASGPCPPSRAVWACISPVSTLDGGGAEPFPNPEAAVAEEQANDPADSDGSRTVLARESSAVVLGWVDDHHLVRRRVTVVSGAEGWRRLKTTRCPNDEPATG